MKKFGENRIPIKRRILYYIMASRIEGGIVASVFLLLGMWYSTQSFSIYDSIITLFATVSIVNSGSLMNYVFDIEADKIAEKNTKFFDYIPPKEMFLISLLLSFLGVLLLLYVGFSVFVVGLLATVVFLVYSAPPIRLKTRPPLDCVANALGFGVFPFFIGWMVSRDVLTVEVANYGCIIGLIVTSYYLFISSFDIEADTEAGIKNSCTLLGFKKTITAAVVIFSISLMLSLLSFDWYSVLPVSLIICFPIVLYTRVHSDKTVVRKLISSLYLTWTGTTLFILSVLSQSVIPILILIIVILISVQVVFIYAKSE